MAAPHREMAEHDSPQNITNTPSNHAFAIPNLALPVYAVTGDVDVEAHAFATPILTPKVYAATGDVDADAHAYASPTLASNFGVVIGDVDAQDFAETLSNEVAKIPSDFQPPTSTKAFPWEQLPYELRDQIFQDINIDAELLHQYFRASAYYSMPPLIIALRGTPKSYQHALQWFRKANQPYNMNGASGYVFGGMITSEIVVLESLDVTISNLGENALVSHDQLVTRPSSIAKSFTKPFLKATSIKNLKLRLQVNDDYSLDFVHFISEFPFWLRGFKTLETLQVKIPVAPWRITEEKRKNVLEEVMKMIEEKVGVMGKCVSCYQTSLRGLLIGDWEREDWEWKAEEGSVMNWSQEGIGMEWTFG